MTDATYLDGNALGGDLQEIFGADMTAQLGSCGGCGAVSVMAEIHVYHAGPGVVARCPSCEQVLMVIVRRPGKTRIGIEMLRWVEISADS